MEVEIRKAIRKEGNVKEKLLMKMGMDMVAVAKMMMMKNKNELKIKWNGCKRSCKNRNLKIMI